MLILSVVLALAETRVLRSARLPGLLPAARALQVPLPDGLSRTRRQFLAAAATAATAAAAPALAVDMTTDLRGLEQQERTVEALFQAASPSVVQIETSVQGRERVSMDPVLVPAGSGSGFIWDKEGHVVTNYHVVRGAAAAKVVVEGSDGKMKEYEAKLVGSNPDKDIAVLQLQGGLGNLVPVTPAVSETGRVTPVRVGQTVLAIGNPFGLDHTLTLGIVSGLGREITSVTGRPITNLLQTDAAINPGNSGGALLDSKGRLIGMNTAILSPSGSNAGIGFAIPVETLKFQVDTLIRDGAVRKPVIGISLASRGQARTLGVQRGVLVMEVPTDSAASKAGIRATERVQYGVRLGDVITGFGEDTVDNETDLFRAIDKYSPGDKVVLTVERLVDKGDGELEQQSATIPLVLSAAESVDPNPRIMKPGER